MNRWRAHFLLTLVVSSVTPSAHNKIQLSLTHGKSVLPGLSKLRTWSRI